MERCRKSNATTGSAIEYVPSRARYSLLNGQKPYNKRVEQPANRQTRIADQLETMHLNDAELEEKGAKGIDPRSPGRAVWTKLILLVFALIAAAVAWYFLGDWLSLAALAEKEQELRQFQARHPLLVYAIAFGIYVLVTGLSLPGATVMTLLLAWYFGFWEALLLISFASTTGATLAFLLSRFLFRDLVQSRFQRQLESFHRAFEQQGPLFLFSLRLIPAVPFFVINAVMGLTNIKAQTFWWVSQLGMLPGTAVYVYAGSRVPSLKRLAEDGINAVLSPQQVTQILIAFILLGLFPWMAKLLLRFFQRAEKQAG